MKLGFRLFTIAVLLTLMGTVPAISQDEATPASLYNDGVAALKAKEYTKALDLFEQSLEKADPEADQKIVSLAQRNGAIAAYYCGRDARKAGNLDESVAFYDKGIEMNPDFYNNYSSKALALNEKEDIAGAIKAFIKASEVAKEDKAPEMLDNARKLVYNSYSKDEWEKTIKLGNIFLENGESADVRFYLARAYKATNQLDQALEQANKAIELAEGGEDDQNYFAQGEIYEAMGNTSAAIAAYKKVTDGKYSEMAQYKVNQMANQ